METNKITATEVHDAIRKVLADKKSYSKSLNYAVEYLRVGLGQEGHELGVQCLYILNNMSGWRNPEAKAIKDTFKQFAKENK